MLQRALADLEALASADVRRNAVLDQDLLDGFEASFSRQSLEADGVIVQRCAVAYSGALIESNECSDGSSAEIAAPVEEAELDEELRFEKLCACLLDQLHGGAGCASGREKVVNQDDTFACGEGV